MLIEWPNHPLDKKVIKYRIKNFVLYFTIDEISTLYNHTNNRKTH